MPETMPAPLHPYGMADVAAGDVLADVGDPRVCIGDPRVCIGDPPVGVEDPPVGVGDPPVSVEDYYYGHKLVYKKIMKILKLNMLPRMQNRE